MANLIEINRRSRQSADDQQGEESNQIEFVASNERMVGEEIQMAGHVGEAFGSPSDQDERGENAKTRREAIQFTIEPRLSDLMRDPVPGRRVQQTRIANNAEKIDDQRSDGQTSVGRAAKFPRAEDNQTERVAQCPENEHHDAGPIDDFTCSCQPHDMVFLESKPNPVDRASEDIPRVKRVSNDQTRRRRKTTKKKGTSHQSSLLY